jgi:tetratricopeptide (TPR) repeat protein
MAPYVFIAVILLLAVLAREFYFFAWLPARAHVAFARGRRPEAKALMERVAGTWSAFGPKAKMETRFRLSWMYLADGDAARAADQCRAILKLRLRPVVEANIRNRLADCLEAGGHAQEAAEQRERAAALVTGKGNDALTAVSRAGMLEQQGRYAEAVSAYEQALDGIPASLTRQRAELKARLALACYNAGRPDDAVRYAEEALAGGVGATMLMFAHSAAGLALSATGRSEEAERHREQALEIALKLGNHAAAAQHLVQLAASHLARGELVRASQEAERAAGLSLGSRRAARLLQAECLRAWGRWEEARDAMLQAREAPGPPVPSDARRSAAIIDLGLALVEIDAGDCEAALARVESARCDFGADTRLLLWSDAIRVLALAAGGRKDEAGPLMDDVLLRLPTLKDDRPTQLMVIGSLARAALETGDFARSRDLWREWLAESPDPVWRPQGLYCLGLAEEALGDRHSARALFQEAAAGVDTYYAARARERLE